MNQTTYRLADNPFDLLGDFVLSAYHENKQKSMLGAYGEKYIHHLLTSIRYSSEIVSHLSYCGDLQVFDAMARERFAIEVKTAFIGNNGRFNFCLNKTNHTSIKYSDFVVLLCIDKELNHYIYVIHTSILNGQSITIASHPDRYAGKYAPFKQSQNICLEVARLAAQLWS